MARYDEGSTPHGAVGPAKVLALLESMLGSVHAAVVARPRRWIWTRSDAWRVHNGDAGDPPRMMVLALTESSLVMYDAHFRAGQLSMGHRLSMWALWPRDGVTVTVDDSSYFPKLTVAFQEATTEALPFEISCRGLIHRGNREALDLLINAFEDEGTDALARLALDAP
jgi:hypothetical protein